ncbi:Hypothetical predicted protein [Podarcis lilfordi]|uniref:Secreted protein n=1 Tax=Podarcis lilfordi TaxID=74358 RepID=A0AA35LKV1_9SAUR|nr:Hypothetical predicted protein [Podarcis lilfordi]
MLLSFFLSLIRKHWGTFTYFASVCFGKHTLHVLWDTLFFPISLGKGSAAAAGPSGRRSAAPAGWSRPEATVFALLPGDSDPLVAVWRLS